jgi:hypothetical protein
MSMRNLSVFLLALLTLASCMSMQQVDLEGATMAEALRQQDLLKVGDAVELSLANGHQVKGKVTAIGADALAVISAEGASVSVPLNEVQTLRTEQFDLVLTASGVVVTYGVVAMVGALILIFALGGTLVI